MLFESWSNRKGGAAEAVGSCRQRRSGTYPRCVQTGLDTYQNALSLIIYSKTTYVSRQYDNTNSDNKIRTFEI